YRHQRPKDVLRFISDAVVEQSAVRVRWLTCFRVRFRRGGTRFASVGRPVFDAGGGVCNFRRKWMLFHSHGRQMVTTKPAGAGLIGRRTGPCPSILGQVFITSIWGIRPMATKRRLRVQKRG